MSVIHKFREANQKRDYLLRPTGKTIFGGDEYVRMTRLVIDDDAELIEGHFQVMNWTGEVENIEGVDKKIFNVFNSRVVYYQRDGNSWTDMEGDPIHLTDANGAVVTESVQTGEDANGNPIMTDVPVERIDMYSVNMAMFGQAISDSMFISVMKYLYNNE